MEIALYLITAELLAQLALYLIGLSYRIYWERRGFIETSVFEKILFWMSVFPGTLCAGTMASFFFRGFGDVEYLAYFFFSSITFLALHFKLAIWPSVQLRRER